MAGAGAKWVRAVGEVLSLIHLEIGSIYRLPCGGPQPPRWAPSDLDGLRRGHRGVSLRELHPRARRAMEPPCTRSTPLESAHGDRQEGAAAQVAVAARPRRGPVRTTLMARGACRTQRRPGSQRPSGGIYLGLLALAASRGLDTLDVIKTTITVAGFVGAVLVGVYGYRKQRLVEGDARRADAEQLAQRYTTAAGQLGHERAAVRLAGVYAMARLADDWDDQRQVCLDVLCAYLRMPYEPDAASEKYREGEREVRHTICPHHSRSSPRPRRSYDLVWS
jgi:hypothetical protein